ncbi:Phenylserine dehydratase [Delftia tsuruhatensis]|uniref:pyridoxal-phosphate dependent enzyme n=1 Tax=Delftia tsuruhatensis TaxID=180282 RepID=UPI001E801334|nr:pyridoxal-phosphate dependent enzyme [Delftia tsuruhatensis]CAB5674315.1 Phenylserine dehydratase [Delftia tsuruhatensis]CAC9683837.1 Phenylserine dehydratase [Delftia tsuruhatensis]
MPLHIVTPLIESPALGQANGSEIWLKLDLLQPSGSFKLRGIGHACETLARQGKRRFIASSGGNAGIAVACAGRQLGIPVTVVVPQTTTEHARAQIRAQGAELRVHGAVWDEANVLAQSLLGAQDAFVHPFDDPLLWQGHSTLVDELEAAGFKPDAVVLAVGGGGLLAGVVQGLLRHGWTDVPVIAAETAGADSLARSLALGRRVVLDGITSVATSLGARQVCRQAFDLAQSHPVRSAVVTDARALDACLRFIDDHRLHVEPACGAALALAYGRSPALSGFRRVLVVACGGTTSTLAQLQQWHAAALAAGA